MKNPLYIKITGFSARVSVKLNMLLNPYTLNVTCLTIVNQSFCIKFLIFYTFYSSY